MPKSSCDKCRFRVDKIVEPPPGTRVNKRKIKTICTERRMNITGKVLHCSKFKGRQGRPKGK